MPQNVYDMEDFCLSALIFCVKYIIEKNPSTNFESALTTALKNVIKYVSI